MTDLDHMSIPLPFSHATQSIYEIDKTGNLHPVRLTLNKTSSVLKIEELEITAHTPRTPLATQASALSSLSSSENSAPPTPATPGPSTRSSTSGIFSTFNFRKSVINLLFKSSSGNSSSSSVCTPTVKYTEVFFPEISEVRFYDFNSKTCILNGSSTKKLKSLTRGSWRMQANKHKIIHVLFGMEFNLKAHKFLVQGTFEKDQQNVVSSWVEQLRNLLIQSKDVGYFGKLDLWYTQQFDKIVAKEENHRLKIWKHFLHCNHHRKPTEILQRICENVRNIVQKANPNFCTGPLQRPEFSVIARYFLHCQSSISAIFDPLKDNREVLYFLFSATDQEIDNNDTLAAFHTFFNDYFSYIQKQSESLPTISSELDIASIFTKSVIRKFAERVQQRETENIVSEHWLCSYYLLDFMYSPDNSIWSPESMTVNQNMCQPLSHYWIQSSHNTYLTGDQYSSQSSVEAYARVLRDGCRCIEIDLWDGPSNKPIVKHGRTLTSAVNLKDVLLTIREHAFVTSPYPVIISLENHCSVAVQKVVAKCFLKIFEKMVVLPGEKVKELPSPEQLKHKIILKGRRLPSLESLKNGAAPESVELEDEERDSEYMVMTGELWKYNENNCNERWAPCIFVLTNKRLYYIGKRESEVSKLSHSWNTRSCDKSTEHAMQDLHHDQLWYGGNVRGGIREVEARLKIGGVNGTFLVRKTDFLKDEHVLNVYYKDENAPINDPNRTVHQLWICKRQGIDSDTLYFMRQNEAFPSIYELIEHYRHNPLITRDIHLDHLCFPVANSQTHEKKEWFYTKINRSEAERILRALPLDGMFLCRYNAETDPGEIVISFRFVDAILHYPVKRDGRFLTVDNKKFVMLEFLLEYYSKKPFYKHTKLRHAVGKELYAQGQKAIEDNARESVKIYASPDYLNDYKNRFIAIQSFNPVDPELLSFKKGDILVNVIKQSDGWWLGTREDAEGEEGEIGKQFPANFVESLEEPYCSPFAEFVEKGCWNLGSWMLVKAKPCKDRAQKQYGIQHYISFTYRNGEKVKLGASCSEEKVMEWVDQLNYVVNENKSAKLAVAAAKYKIARELSDLIYLPSLSKKIGPEEYVEEMDVCLTKSLEEVRGDRLFRSNPQFFVWYHTRALTRIYPRGFRLDSSNYSPERYWNTGSQMVALNFQTPDKPMQWNRGKFRQNGNCGYVLKPEFMRATTREQAIFDPMRGIWGSHDTIITLRIIGARHLTKPGIGQICPLVEIQVVGVGADRYRVKTSAKGTGLNPHWNETVELRLRCPDLALIQFTILDSAEMDKLFLGEATIPFPCIRRAGGYRSIQLNNEYGTPLLATLLVHTTVNQQMPTFDKPPLPDSHNL